MAVRASREREVVFDASPEAILDVLADIEALPTWSSVYKKVTVLDRDPDGKPCRVKATLRLMGITDNEILEYHWCRHWVVWDAEKTFQHGYYGWREPSFRGWVSHCSAVG